MALEPDTVDQAFTPERLDQREQCIRLVVDTFRVEVVLILHSLAVRREVMMKGLTM